MIYFIHDPEADRIKIGKARNLDERLYALRSQYGSSLSVMATMPGSFPEEGKLHQRFRHLRLPAPGREWFQTDKELIDFIESLSELDELPPGESAADRRVTAVNLKSEPEYKEWLDRVASMKDMPVSVVVRAALVDWARANGLPLPPGVPEAARPKRGKR